MATAVELALAEINASLMEIVPIHEGLRDFASVNIKPETKVIVDAAIVQYDERVAKLNAAKEVLEKLVDDGHPVLNTQNVRAAVYADLKDQTDTMLAALPKFQANEAETLVGSVTLEEKGTGA